MAEIFHFEPKAELEAKENLQEFIRQCRYELTVYGADLIWDNWRWPNAANFTKIGVNSRVQDDSNQLDQGIIDFSKAYFRYQQGHKPTHSRHELMALRVIEIALLQVNGCSDINGISICVLDEAALIARKNYSKATMYHCGRELQRLAEFVEKKKLVSANVGSWVSPIRRAEDTIKTGKEAKKAREAKLPDTDAVAALTEIFSNRPSEPKDIFTTSTFAMLMCAPSRITEILELPLNCEHTEKDSNGTERYGWRFYSGKGYEGDIKWIPSTLVGAAREAIQNIIKITNPARKLAKWVEDNPTKFYRHENCPDVADDALLTMEQVCMALGLVYHSFKICRTSLGNYGLTSEDYVHSLDSLWTFVMSRQPKGFPWVNKEKKIKYSDALFCMTRNMLHKQRGVSPVILWLPTNNIFNNDVSPRESLGEDRYHKSIFDRHGYKTQDGKPLRLTSHQPRHLLNTIAQRGGLSQLEIAKWSGRKDVNQNRVYNHISETESVEKAEKLGALIPVQGLRFEFPQYLPVSQDEFELLERGPNHVTEYGFCTHDYTMSVCDKYRDCLNCTEHFCVKGDVEKNARVRKRAELIELQLQAAEDEIKKGVSGADRWYEHHSKTIEYLRQLLAIFDDPDVPDEAKIQLRYIDEFSQLRRVLKSKIPFSINQAPDKGLVEEKMKKELVNKNG